MSKMALSWRFAAVAFAAAAATAAALVSAASPSASSHLSSPLSVLPRVSPEGRAPFEIRGDEAPRGWERLSRAPEREPVELLVALRRSYGGSDSRLCRDAFWAVSDPTNVERYGRFGWASAACTAELVADAQAEQTVRSYFSLGSGSSRGGKFHTDGSERLLKKLLQHGHHLSLGRELLGAGRGSVLVVNTTVAVAEALLDCQFFEFQHVRSGMRLLRAPRYSLPVAVANDVSFVGGVMHFPEPFRAQRSLTQTLLHPSGQRELQRFPSRDANLTAVGAGFGVTPRLVRERYTCQSAEGGKAPQNRQAAASFLGQYFDEVDLQEFYALFMQEMVGRTPDRVVGSQGLIPGVEANLDVQYITAIGLYTSTWVYSTEGLHQNQEPFFKWMQLVANETDAEVPKTISISYGDNEDSITPAYMQRVDEDAMHLGARGISLLFASGDSGVSCTDDGKHFEPNFPVDLPSVTAVGGTTTNGFLETGPEVCNSLSGGGFSNRFAAPSYQRAAVAAFLKNSKDLPPDSFYNRTGRAYPDVAALSSGFWVTYAGIPTPVAGTSCAAPSFGAVVGLLNQVRLEQKKPTLGFLNPLFYSLGATHGTTAFNDATAYCNSGCQATNGIGFCAIPGWDAATGWGSPNFAVLSTLI